MKFSEYIKNKNLTESDYIEEEDFNEDLDGLDEEDLDEDEDLDEEDLDEEDLDEDDDLDEEDLDEDDDLDEEDLDEDDDLDDEEDDRYNTKFKKNFRVNNKMSNNIKTAKSVSMRNRNKTLRKVNNRHSIDDFYSKDDYCSDIGYNNGFGSMYDSVNEESVDAINVVNATPHPIKYQNGDISVILPASGIMIRVDKETRKHLSPETRDLIALGADYKFTPATDDVGITGLPPEEKGTIYIVSGMTASLNKTLPAGVRRTDLYVPGGQVRGKNGFVSYCTSFEEGF